MIGTTLLALALAAPNAAAAPSPTSEGSKLVCQTSPELGSRIPRRTCRTKAQWEQIAREAEGDARSAYGGVSGLAGTIVPGAYPDGRAMGTPSTGPEAWIMSPRPPFSP